MLACDQRVPRASAPRLAVGSTPEALPGSILAAQLAQGLQGLVRGAMFRGTSVWLRSTWRMTWSTSARSRWRCV